jgi:NADH:ubiquinone oxidoreductase subunit D
MRQSLWVIARCLKHMPPGAYKIRHPLATPPLKERTLRDMETLISLKYFREDIYRRIREHRRPWS